jgi:hypothetical protein
MVLLVMVLAITIFFRDGKTKTMSKTGAWMGKIKLIQANYPQNGLGDPVPFQTLGFLEKHL